MKLSSEAAESIALTPVVVQEMPVAELVEVLLGVAGKDVERVLEILARGTLVSGATRFRWQAIDAGRADIESVLRRFPDPDPSRVFGADRCIRVLLRGAPATVELARDVAARRRFLRRRSVWDALMALAAQSTLEYIDYSYKDRADRFRLKLSPAAQFEIRAAAGLAAYAKLAARLRGLSADTAEFLVARNP